MQFHGKFTVKSGNFCLSAAAVFGGVLILVLTKVQNLMPFHKGMPDAGFFPMLCGAGIILCGLGNLLNTLRRSKARDPALEKNLIDKNELINFSFVIGLSLFTLIAYRWIGILVCQFFVVLVVCRYLSKESWVKSLLIAAGTFVVFYLVFVVGLNLPMPNSLVGI